MTKHEWRATMVRTAIRQLPLTRREIAARLKVSKRTIDGWMLPDGSRGHHTPPESTFRALCKMGSPTTQQEAK